MTTTICSPLLQLDVEAECARIEVAIREQVFTTLSRRGAVLGLSGGIDSSVVGALCARALGSDRVLGLLMPEADSSSESKRLGRLLAETFSIPTELEDVTSILSAVGCYTRRDAAIRRVDPEYTDDCRCKLVLPDMLGRERYALSSLVVQKPGREERKIRLTAEAYSEIVAATNFKQRTRKMLEYYHADRLRYAVAGTPNRLEYDQGFFVKNGDGSADFKPIAHLYKTQVYELAAYLGVPEEIRSRPSTTDTFSLPQSQEEFFFSVPLETLDLCVYGLDHGIAATQIAELTDLSEANIQLVFRYIEQKRRSTRYLHLEPLLISGADSVTAKTQS
jgi:NAD+ synthase